jgi:DHA2 family multidrug resistance protein
MTAFTAGREKPASEVFLVGGIVLAALTEAIAGTILSLGRGDIMGDIHAIPDSFAWLDVGYISLKLIGFILAPWLMTRLCPRHLALGATLVMGAACGIAGLTDRLDLLVILRVLQGIAGGVILVSGQALIFFAYPRSLQPILQALFAMGSVVAPAVAVPAFQGWLLDTQSWTWIFLSVAPLAIAAAGLLSQADDPPPTGAARQPFDWLGFSLICVALCFFTYIFSQGSRWDWFEEPRIIWLTAAGGATLAAFASQQLLCKSPLIDFRVFRSADFSFAFLVSFVAGAALFGSAYLIQTVAISVLAFPLASAGQLLLPGGALFFLSLFIAALFMQLHRLPPVTTVPFGILLIIGAMWMLSGVTSESGASDMMVPLLLRGFGLGFLFLSITLIAFNGLTDQALPYGIGLFNAGRQFGGLIGVAGLQTLINHNWAANMSVIGANISAGLPAVSERLTAITAAFVEKGMDPAAAGRAATSLFARTVAHQSTVIAFDTAFNAVALLFVFAAPILVLIKIGLSRSAARRPCGRE